MFVVIEGEKVNDASRVFTLEKYINKAKTDKYHYSGAYTLCKINKGVSTRIDRLDIEEFEEAFGTSKELMPFTLEEIDSIFSVKVAKKYGRRSMLENMDPIGKNNLKPGYIYINKNESKFIYIGKVNMKYDYKRNKASKFNSSRKREEEGYGYINNGHLNSKVKTFEDLMDLKQNYYNLITTVKNPRRVIYEGEKAFNINKSVYNGVIKTSYGVETLDVEFL